MVLHPEVPFSELINKPKATREKLSRSRTRELRLRSRGDEDLILREASADRERTEMVDTAVRFLTELMKRTELRRSVISDIAPEVFPWIRFLPEDSARRFLGELADMLRDTIEFDNPAPAIHQLVVEWRHTAEVYADPEVLDVLTREDGRDEDFGPVPPPPGSHQ